MNRDEAPEGSIGGFNRQRSVGMTQSTEDRVLLLGEMNGMTASAVMRQALMIGMDQLDPQGRVTRYRLPAQRTRAEAIRASLRAAASRGSGRARDDRDRAA